MHKNKLFVLPYPPPFAGPEIIAKTLLNSRAFVNKKDIVYVNANIRYSNSKKGNLDIKGMLMFLKRYLQFLVQLLHSKTVFMYLCSSRVGFLRDSIYILTSWLLRKKCVAQYHGGNFNIFFADQSAVYQGWIRFTLKKLSSLIVLAESLRFMFKDCYKGKIDVLHNGLNPDEYSAKNNFHEGPFTIFFMGHLSYSKGFYDLVDAYKLLYLKYGTKIKLIFAGENFGFINETASFLTGKWKEDFLKNGKKKNREIQEFVSNTEKWKAQYLGFVSGLPKKEAFKKSTLFVLPSYTEGFSMACLEAMAAGLPVITTPVGAMSEIVRHNENGLITETGNPERLAQDIESFIAHPEKARSIGGYNRQYVEKYFNIEKIAKQLLDHMDALQETL